MQFSPPYISVFSPNNYLWLYLLSIAVFEALVVYLYQFRKTPGATPLILNLSCKAIWLLSRVLYGISATVPFKLFWVNISQVLQILFILFWFEFILEVSQQKEKIPLFVRRCWYGTAACLMAIILSNDLFGWYWGAISMNGSVMKLAFGPAAVATLWICYALNLLSLAVCIRWVMTVQGLRRWQAIALSVAPVFMLSGNILGRVALFKPFAPQLIGLLLGGIYTTWVFYRFRLYSILPLAHDAVTRSIIDGLLVVDEKGYIVEMNPTVRKLLSDSPAKIGATFKELFDTWPALISFDNSSGTQKLETVHTFPEGDRHFRIDMTPLITTGNHLLGKVFVLKDITRQKLVQAQLFEQQKTLSILAERNRIGRDLHDTQGQFPGYVKAQTQAIKLLLQNERSTDAIIQLDQLKSAANSAFNDTRETMACLNTVATDWDFSNKLQEWLNRFRSISGINVDYSGPEVTQQSWIAPEAEVHLLRIIQESMTNARKHADAQRITIDVSLDDDMLTLKVADNGRGFDEQDSSSGFGLVNIRERAEEMGGSCGISSTPVGGTTITVQAPLRRDVHEHTAR